MAPRIVCPECQEEIDIKSIGPDNRARCRICNKLFEIPAFVVPAVIKEINKSREQVGIREAGRHKIDPLGFNWGAFFLTSLWLMFHGVPGWGILLLFFNILARFSWLFVPAEFALYSYLSPVVISWAIGIYVGRKGYKIAWENKDYSSIEDMQKKENIWGIVGGVLFAISIMSCLGGLRGYANQ